MREATNVLTVPQGGVKKRPGMEFLDDVPGSGRMENFSFNVEQNYLLVFTASLMTVYKDGVQQTTVATPWSVAQLADIDFIQSADTAIVTHEDVSPRSITRTSDTSWTISTLSLSNIPIFDFNDGSSPSAVSEIQTAGFTGGTQGDTYKISLDGILTEEIAFGNSGNEEKGNIQQALQELPNTGNSGITVTGSKPNYTITFGGDSARPYGLCIFTPISTIGTVLSVAVARTQTGVSAEENSWSGGRGWPRTATFHEGRLWFGGSKSRPATLWGSRVGDFFNFDKGRGRDDEGVEATLDTDQVNAIEAVFSNRSLQVFTSGGEFFVPDSPITPSNIAVRPQSNLGSKRVRPVTIDGVTLFVQRTGKALNQFVFINEFQANQSRSVSVLAQHIIKDPIKIAASRGTESSDANYVYIMNSDGTVTVFNTLISEDVTAFTTWITDGFIESLAVVDNTVNFLVKRNINSVDKYYVEKENDLLNTDSAAIGTGLASDTLTGLTHLNTETVKVKADGAVQDDEVVSGGSITIGRTADTIEAGLEYQPVIETMPLNNQLKNGPNAASKKRIVRAAVNIFESNGIIINGQRISDKTIGVDQFDAPAPQTGVRRVFLHGWSLEASITITQDTPMPLQILSLGLEVKT